MQKLNFRTRDYSHIYFASDFHVDHMKDFVWEPRGFKDWKSHTDFILAALRNLQSDDLLIYLGDFALNTSDERVEKILNEIPCDTYMCWGNHNSGVKSAYQKAKAQFMSDNNFSTTCDFYPLKIAPNVFMMGDSFYVSIDGRKFYCNHFASKTWDGMQHGWGHLHGHSHGGLEGSQPEECDDGKVLDVGVDNALKYNKTPFFSFQEICSILDEKPVKIVDHHD
jgi:calcineurin-like phosphoesterase family protein